MVYLGSKARFAKELLPIILRNRKPNQWYVEPFAGGMNLICEVQGNRIANDAHYYLIEMWRELVNGWIPKPITRERYYKIKNKKHKYPAHVVGWAGFSCSFSGKWFSGYAGNTKTKIGTIRNYQAEAFKNIRKQVRKMKDVVFQNCSYDELNIPPNSIVYCDPPYEGTYKYSNEFDHEHFWDWVRELNNQDHVVFVSEYNAPSDFECVWKKRAKSSLSANGVSGGSKISIEKLFILKNSGIEVVRKNYLF